MGSVFTLHKGRRKADLAPVTVFVFDGSKAGNAGALPVAKNAVKRMKTLKHPNFLKFIDR